MSYYLPPIIRKSKEFLNKRSIIEFDSESSWTYRELIFHSLAVYETLKKYSLANGESVAFLTEANFNFPRTLFGIWLNKNVSVPLCTSHTEAEIEHALRTTKSKLVIADPIHREKLSPLCEKLNIPLSVLKEVQEDSASHLPDNFFNFETQSAIDDEEVDANILFTSGTTSLPKGVLTTHERITNQIETLTEAWKWTEKDYIINTLPLHHTHGLVNVLLSGLYNGATIEMHKKFSPKNVFSSIQKNPVTLFMAVPTIYYKLISFFDDLSMEEKETFSDSFSLLRLMISGSAALPTQTFEKWKQITGHTLLERYGMTEIGMAISNPYFGERRPGHIGRPLPGVEIRLVSEDGRDANKNSDHISEPGEIYIRSPYLFKEYIGLPEKTKDSFDNGWFKTGDIARWNQRSLKILGRNSVDIIKSGGYKISALEIEAVLRNNDAIEEVAVVGIENPEWGEVIAAYIVPRPESELEDCLQNEFENKIKNYCCEKLSNYKTPKIFLRSKILPKNSLGKVLKPEIRKHILAATSP